MTVFSIFLRLVLMQNIKPVIGLQSINKHFCCSVQSRSNWQSGSPWSSLNTNTQWIQPILWTVQFPVFLMENSWTLVPWVAYFHFAIDLIRIDLIRSNDWGVSGGCRLRKYCKILKYYVGFMASSLNISVVFKQATSLRSILFKPRFDQSNRGYLVGYENCIMVYVGMTTSNVSVRIHEHSHDVSAPKAGP